MSAEALEIFERDTTISPRKLRTVGYVPATIYGKGREPQSIQVKSHPLHMALKAGHKAFTLKGLGSDIQADVKQLQKVSTREEILHVEFHVK